MIQPNSPPCVLVTRPIHQQAEFIQRCEDAGFEAISLACMDILAITCEISTDDISTPDLVFFTSRNAVEFAHNIQPLPWPNTKVYAVGRSTARVLERLGQELGHPPIAPYSSEAFLDWIKTQPQVKHALIVKGASGRDVLENYFLESGATVSLKEVYKRVLPAVSDAMRHRIFVETPPDIISVTSDEVLRNLLHIAGREYTDVVRGTPLVVNSERCAELALRLNFDYAAIVANPAGNDGQVEALIEWAQQRSLSTSP